MSQDYKILSDQKLKNEALAESLSTLPSYKNVSLEQIKEMYAKSEKLNSNMSIDEFVQEFSVRLSELKIFHDQYISNTKSFADIAIGGPKNISEVALMEAACSLLSPDEFQDAIVTRKSVSDVFSMIDKSKAKKITNDIILQRHVQLQQELQSQQQPKTVWQDKVASQKGLDQPNFPSRSK